MSFEKLLAEILQNKMEASAGLRNNVEHDVSEALSRNDKVYTTFNGTKFRKSTLEKVMDFINSI